MRSCSTLAVLICACTCFLSTGVLVPVLPQYLAGELHQGFDKVGLAVAVPSVTAIVASVAGAGLLALVALALLGAGPSLRSN